MKRTERQSRTMTLIPMLLALAMALGGVLMPMQAWAAPQTQMGMGGMSEMSGRGQHHVVRQGETLSGIAQQYGTSVRALMQANGISDPNHIYSGQRLVIPSDMGGMTGGEMGGMSGGNMGWMGDNKEVMCKAHHTVMHGETALDIAMRYQVSTYSLAQANGLDDANQIRVGQKLCIPAGPPPVNAPTTGIAKPDKPKPMPMPMPDPMPMPMPKPMPMPDPPHMEGGCQYHRVQKGDTLAAIAAKYGTSVHALMKLNGLRDPNKIDAGQMLKISCEEMGWMPEPMPMPMPKQQPMPMAEPPMREPMRPMTAQPMMGGMEGAHNRPMPDPMPRPMPMPMPEHKGMSLRPQETWRGSYYCTKDLSGDPVMVRDDYDVRFNWYGNSPGEGLPEDRFSVRWERNVHFDGSSYQFTATADDGVRVYVGDKLIIDAWREQPATTYTADVMPPAGVHKVVVEYYEEANMASVDVRWEKAMTAHRW